MQSILMFHGVDDTGSVLSVSPKQLASMVRSIRKARHQIVPLATLLDGHAVPNAVAMTFDDGFKSVFEHAAPIFRAEAVPATLFLTTGYVGRTNQWPTQSPDMPAVPMMTWSDVEDLMAEGWSIDAHTVNHPDLRLLDDDTLKIELSEPRTELKRRLGRDSTILAYPYGYYDQRTVDFTKQVYRYAVTTEMGLVDTTAPHTVARIDAYYLRSPAVHREFGGRRFRAYVMARRALRRWRGHPGEIS